MRKKWLALIALLIAAIALFLPAAVIHVHSQLGEETSSLFPSGLSLWQVVSGAGNALPMAQVQGLRAIPFGGWMALGSLLLVVLSAGLALCPAEKGTGPRFGGAALCLGGAFAFHMNNLSASLYFRMLLDFHSLPYGRPPRWRW